jgi:hypothetical protein
MPNRLAIFIDDFACCAQLGTGGGDASQDEPAAPATPIIALSSQVLISKAGGERGFGALVCHLVHEPRDLQRRLSTDLDAAYELVGLQEALRDPAGDSTREVRNQMEDYLAVLIGSCLKTADAAGRIDEVVVALPLRSQKEEDRAKEAIGAIARLFEGKKFALADAHDLLKASAHAAYQAHNHPGKQFAVVALWRDRFSILLLEFGKSKRGSGTLPIEVTASAEESPKASFRTPIVQALAPTRNTRLDTKGKHRRLVPPQATLESPDLYGATASKLAADFAKAYQNTPQFAEAVLKTTVDVVQVGAYALIGSLAINPAIRAGLQGTAASHQLTRILGNQLVPGSLSLRPGDGAHPVMGVLAGALQTKFADEQYEMRPEPRVAVIRDEHTAKVESGDPVTAKSIAGIAPVTFPKEQREKGKVEPLNITVGTTTQETADAKVDRITALTLLGLPSDSGYGAMVEYGRLEDGSIMLQGKMNKRVLPLAKDPKIELLDNGGYRLTLDDQHKAECDRRRRLHRLVTEGLCLHGSDGNPDE